MQSIEEYQESKSYNHYHRQNTDNDRTHTWEFVEKDGLVGLVYERYRCSVCGAKRAVEFNEFDGINNMFFSEPGLITSKGEDVIGVTNMYWESPDFIVPTCKQVLMMKALG